MLDPATYPALLLIAANHVGNNLFMTPAIRLLKRRRPEIRLDVVSLSGRGAEVFEGNPDIARIRRVFFEGQVRRLARRYPGVIGLHRDTATRCLAGSGGQSWILGLARHAMHRAEEVLVFIGGLVGCTISDEDRQYVLCPQPRHAQRVSHLLAGAKDGQRLVGMHLGTGRTSSHGWKFWYSGRERDARLWPHERYVALAKLLRQRDERFRCVLTGSPNDKFLARRFMREVPDAIDLMGATSLLDLAALMPRLSVFVTQDTGALHVACSSTVPLVGLFGPTNPARTGPFPIRPQYTIIKKAATAEITPEEVADVVVRSVGYRG